MSDSKTSLDTMADAITDMEKATADTVRFTAGMEKAINEINQAARITVVLFGVLFISRLLIGCATGEPYIEKDPSGTAAPAPAVVELDPTPALPTAPTRAGDS